MFIFVKAGKGKGGVLINYTHFKMQKIYIFITGTYTVNLKSLAFMAFKLRLKNKDKQSNLIDNTEMGWVIEKMNKLVLLMVFTSIYFKSQAFVGMHRSTKLISMVKNTGTLWNSPRFLLPVTYIITKILNPRNCVGNICVNCQLLLSIEAGSRAGMLVFGIRFDLTPGNAIFFYYLSYKHVIDRSGLRVSYLHSPRTYYHIFYAYKMW